MGIYYSGDGSSFTSTLDVQPNTFFTRCTNDDINLDISFSDFMRVCNLLNYGKKNIIAAIVIQRWWRNIQIRKKSVTIIQRWWRNIQIKKKSATIIQTWWRIIQNKSKKQKNDVKINKFSIWNFLWL